MKKNIASYLIIVLTICILLFASFSSNKTIDSSKYSTAGLVLNYTVSQDAGSNARDLALLNTNKAYSPLFGEIFCRI